jgi:murein DD-endopeptidase MepM/ murein hydrolase activator NlpD
MKGCLCFALLLLTNFSVTAQEYLWPTDASQFITSSFCESRSRRFHAAIDVKTWNQTGYKTFAVRSGYIERMAISPFGYGRVLYLRLDNGETAVYAHLEAFNEQLQAVAEQEQERVGRYRIDKFFRPGMLPVQQGEVIGYTGQTGIGTPHLHFELRDSRNRPINPFLRGFKIVDTIPPTISVLAISPLAPGAMVNGDFSPLVLRPYRYNGKWRVAEPIHIAGKVGVAIDGYDQADGTDNRFGFYRLQLFVDDSLQFQAQYDRFNYAQNKLIELDRDYLLKRRGFGDLQRLYRVVGNGLGFYSHLNAAGGALLSPSDELTLSQGHDELTPVPDLAALTGLRFGAHRLQVVVADFFGNLAIAETDLVVGSPYTIVPQVAANQSTRLQIKSIQAPPARQIQKLEAAVANSNSRSMISPWRSIAIKTNALMPSGARSNLASFADTLADSSWQIGAAFELQTGGAQLVRLVAVDQYGLRSHPVFIAYPPARTSSAPLLIDVEKDFYPNYLRLVIRANQPLMSAPTIKFDNGKKIFQADCIPQQPYRYIAAVPLAEIAGDSVHLEVTATGLFGQQETWQDWFMNALVQPGRGKSLFAPDGRMRVAFSEESLYWPLYGRVGIDTVTRIRDSRVIGPIYRVEPQDVALDDGAVVTIIYPDTVSQPQQLGVCYLHRNDWVFIDNKINTANHTVSARVFSLEDFAIIRDNEPPVLSIRAPLAGSVTRNRRLLFSVGVNDGLSGFESEESIELRLDGQKLIAEYDPEREVVQYRSKKDLEPGVHKLTARAEDRCGNVSWREVEFTVR